MDYSVIETVAQALCENDAIKSRGATSLMPIQRWISFLLSPSSCNVNAATICSSDVFCSASAGLVNELMEA